ncbi:23S rRNA (adenine(2503)-C(2))-methyltransferase RlmN [bacterium]|nr:23S rRNA (adenine(2503)-C(2))-methyltransferase RlmN [bacterium]
MTSAENTVKKPHALELDQAQLTTLLKSWGEPGYRAVQVLKWIWTEKQMDPAAMSNLPAGLRAKLAEGIDWFLPEVHSSLAAGDGSTKLLLKTATGQFMEAVILRYENRTSLCVSSQVGCKLACSFCQTGKLGFFRHLAAHEILAQYVMASNMVRGEGRRISHVVFMGMGEPLDNYQNVVTTVRAMLRPEEEFGFGLSNRHVTVSTSGIAPKIVELAKDVKCALALSLHAARDDLRTELMPVNRRWPLADLKAALADWQQMTGGKITLEYILIKDKNCGPREAKELVKFIHGLRAKVNLIPFNAHPGLPFERPGDGEIRAFQKHLAERSIPAPVRYSKGLEVSAACGQLAAKQIENLSAIPSRKSVIGADAR